MTLWLRGIEAFQAGQRWLSFLPNAVRPEPIRQDPADFQAATRLASPTHQNLRKTAEPQTRLCATTSRGFTPTLHKTGRFFSGCGAEVGQHLQQPGSDGFAAADCQGQGSLWASEPTRALDHRSA